MTTLNRRADEFEYGRRDLYQQLQAVYTYVQAHMALLTPVRRLPRDIIQEIFIACLPEDRNCVMSALEAPVLLGQVCSSWRTISLSTPRLWARLHIVEPLLPREPSVSKQLLHAEKHAQRIETTKAWLARSGECPLSLSFSSESSQWGAEGVDAPNIFFQVLVLFARRWQDIRLVASPGALMHLSCLREDDVPMLKSLDIRELRPPTEFNAVTPWEYFGLLSCPKMSSFTIHGGFQVASLLPLPWESLTSLTIFGWGSSDRLNRHRALEILRKSPRLRVANLGITDEDGVSAPAVGECDTALELSDLHSLRIVCDPWIFIDNRLFSHLNLPKLRNLRVDIRSPEAVPADIYLFPFLRASPQLQNLEINFHRFSKRQLIDLFAALPSTIQELRLLDSPDGSLGENTPEDHTLAALIPTPDRPLDECCPNLAVFDITYSVDVSDEALLRFITARMAVQPAALRRVHIRFDRLRQLDICAKLQLFLDSGLEVALEYNDDRPVDLSPWRGVEQDLV
ncbi:hypothetical protein B0H16DRAFT_1544045 [Mycena metata]|uniref:F-box domain-containing protein n=1 Tax=Mycena metata TaxID=1033252 RepID=A0AAD7IZQ6_9AGAR|nr:hypothetical protein B0H16DRAFT_1544045 [Mycena metata]